MARTSNKIKVMLDSNVIISGITCPRHCFEILNHALKQDFNLFLSEIILEEVKRNIQKKFQPYLLNLKSFLLNCPFELVPDPEKDMVLKNQNLVPHQNDVPVILAAIESMVDFFITGDKEIIKECVSLKGKCAFLTPTNFLKEIMRWTTDDLDKISFRNWENFKK